MHPKNRMTPALLTLLLALGLAAAQTTPATPALKTAQVFQGHFGSVEGFVYSPDGARVLVIAGQTGHILDARTYQVLRKIPIVASASGSQRWTAANTLQLSGMGRVVSLDLSTGKQLDEHRYVKDSIGDVRLSNNGLVAVEEEQEVGLYDAAAGTRARSILYGEDFLRHLELNSSGDRLALNTYDRGVWLHNTDTGDIVRPLATRDEFPDAFAFTPDGQQLVVSKGSYQRAALNVYNSADGSLAYQFGGAKDSFSGLAFSPRGTWLAGVRFGDIHLFDVEERTLKYRLELSGSGGVEMAFSPDEGTLAYGNWYGDIHFASTKTGRVVKELKGLPGSSQWCAVLSPDGRRVMTCGYDRTARIYDVVTGKTILALSGHPAWVKSGVFLPRGNGVVTASDDYIVTWSGQGKRLKAWSTDEHSPDHLTPHPDGKLVAYTARNYDTNTNVVFVLNVDTGDIEAKLKVGPEDLQNLAFSPDGKTLAGVDGDGRVTLWDWNRETVRASVRLGAQYRDLLTFDPRGQFLAVLAPEGGVNLLDARTLRKVRFIRLHGASFAQFSASGGKLVVRGGQGKAEYRVFDPGTGQLLRSYAAEWGGNFVLTPDGKGLLVEGGAPGSPVNATLLVTPDAVPAFK